MTQKISITLDENVLKFVDSQTNNRSQFINEILSNLQKQQKLKELESAYIQQAQDSNELEEIALWEQTISDGLTEDE